MILLQLQRNQFYRETILSFKTKCKNLKLSSVNLLKFNLFIYDNLDEINI